MIEENAADDFRMYHPEACCEDYCFPALRLHNLRYGEARSMELALFMLRRKERSRGFSEGLREAAAVVAAAPDEVFASDDKRHWLEARIAKLRRSE